MKMGSGAIFLVLIIVAFFRWFNHEEEKTKAENSPGSRGNGLGLGSPAHASHRRSRMKRGGIGPAVLFPLLAVLTIVVFGGGLGIIFTVLNESALGEWGVIILGMALVVGVPGIAALLERTLERG